MDLINLNFVFEKHYEALKENSETREIIINFMLLPAFFSAILVCFGFNISNGFRSALITSIAIFVGFLINVLILINTTKDRKNENNNQNNQVAVKREEVIQELFIHTLYSIIIGLISAGLMVLVYVIYKKTKQQKVLREKNAEIKYQRDQIKEKEKETLVNLKLLGTFNPINAMNAVSLACSQKIDSKKIR